MTGMSADKVLTVCTSGLDEHWSGSGAGTMFGAGIYLAEDAAKCDQYTSRTAAPTGKTHQHLRAGYTTKKGGPSKQATCIADRGYKHPDQKDDTHLLHNKLYPGGRREHPGGDVNYLLVCRVTLGYVLRTQWGCSHRITCRCGKADLHSKGQGVAMDDGATDDGTVFISKDCKELQHVPGTAPGIRHHSLLAELNGNLKRYREFVIFHGHQVYP
jgi:hypothetical protein